MRTEVLISCDWYEPDELVESLRECISETAESDIDLEIRKGKHLFRGPVTEPTVLVALVAGGSAAISALINSIFRLLEKKIGTPGRIVIRGSDGTTIEVPSDIGEKQLRNLADFAGTLGAPKIELVKGKSLKPR